MIHVGPLEAVYTGSLLLVLGLTVYALVEALRDRQVVKALNGKAREIAVGGDIRDEVCMIVVYVLLLTIAVPAAFSDRETVLSHIVIVLMLIPLVLLTRTALRFRERRRLIGIIARESAR